MNLQSIKKRAKSIFESNKDLQILIATEDGQLFIEKDKSYAENHATKDNGKARDKKLKVYTLKREDILKMKDSDYGITGSDSNKK